MKKLTSNCDYPTLILCVLWLIFDIAVLAFYIATAEKVNADGVFRSLPWVVAPIVFIVILYKEGTK